MQVVADTSPTTACQPTARRYPRFAITSSSSGIGNSAGAAKGRTWPGTGWQSWPTNFSRSPVSCIPGRACGLPSDTRGRTRVREFRLHGSVRGALSNGRPLYVAACSARTSPWTGGPKAYRVALRALTTIELKNPKTSSGCVSKIWFCSSGSVIQGCLFRVQKCAVGHSQEVSSKVPARTL